jgi:UDP-2,3-diacylglucosamine pyrophosphatase LpxH
MKEQYLMAVYLVYSRASLNLQKRARTEGKDYKGIVMGHTHLPFQHQSPELPLLLDDGDMTLNQRLKCLGPGLSS